MKDELINKAVYLEQFGGPNELVLKTSSVPHPNKHQVRVKIAASSVSTTDRIIRKGMFPPMSKKPPFVMGYDFIGKVDQLGSQVNGLKVGDWVTGIPMTGGYANYVCIDSSEVCKIPEVKNVNTAAPITLFYITAYQMLEHFGDLKTGDKVLVQAATGSVGQAILQLGKIKGLNMVGTGSKSKLNKISRHGAIGIDYRSRNYKTALKDAAGSGFDAVFDCINHDNINFSYSLLKKRGFLVTYGLFNKATKVEKRTISSFVKFITSFLYLIIKLKIWNLGSKSAYFYDIQESMKKRQEQFQKDLTTLHKYLENGSILPAVHKIFRLDEAIESHAELEETSKDGYIMISNE